MTDAPQVAATDPSPAARALRAALAATPDTDIAQVYAARGFRPIWTDRGRMGPAGQLLLSAVARSADHGLDPSAYPLAETAAAVRGADRGGAALARADLALSSLLVDWVGDLHRAPPGAEMLFTDAALARPPDKAPEILRQFSEAPSPERGLARLQAMNPIYDELRVAWREAADRGQGATAGKLRANLERARALPASLGTRYVLVDVAAQELEVWDHGKQVASMPVIVGRPDEPTPSLAGMIRFLVLNPYWHMPPDIAAKRVAPLARKRGGANVLADRDLELMSSFLPDARRLDPEAVDWAEVAAGRQSVHLRQRPGAGNMMGQVKFIFPNHFGVYLHDTPLRQAFASASRAGSAGCVRVSDAPELARLLLGTEIDLSGSGAPEERLELSTPMPVYLIYLTMRPRDGSIEARSDLYDRDAALMARLGPGRDMRRLGE